MVRKQVKVNPKILENIVEDCLASVDALKYLASDKDTKKKEEKCAILLRLFLSGLGQHFFNYPDDTFEIGFLRLEKSPDKDELFKVKILRNFEAGVTNAETLWKYYNGELMQENKFKEVIEGFMKELILYSQEQEVEITNLTNNIEKKKRRKKNGI